MANGAFSEAQWEMATTASDEELRRRGSPILFAECTGDTILTASARPGVKLWRLHEGELTSSGHLPCATPSCMAVSSSRDRVSVCTQDGQTLLWDLRDPSPAVLQSLIAQANRVAFVGDHLVTGGSSGKVCVWNHRKQQVEREIAPNTGEELRNGESHKRRRLDGNKVATTFSQVGRISSLCGSPDGRLLACGRDSGAAMRWQ